MILTPQQTFELARRHQRAGRWAEAETLYRQLLARDPNNSEVLHWLGLAVYHAGRYPEACELMQRFVAAQPQAACGYNNLGLLFAKWKRLDESVAAFETALKLEPGNPEFHYHLGITRTRQRRWAEGIASYRMALQWQPRHLQAWLNLGLAMASAGRTEEAIAVYRQAQEHCPGEVSLAINLGVLFKEQGRLDEALAALQSAARLAPGHPIVLSNLGSLLKDRGEIAAAVTALRQSLASADNAAVHSDLILTLLFDPQTDRRTIQEEHRRWNTRYAAPLRAQRLPHGNERSPDRRLRIGYVSADLRNHVVGRTLLPVVQAHDRAQVECVCYGSTPADSLGARFQARADLWRSVETWTDAELAAQVRADGIDILVDLGLHTAHNRLLTFSRKPAPVQVSWLGYPASSGLETIACWLSDAFLDPAGSDETEEHGRSFRLPHAWCCYPPPEETPEVCEPPAARRGHITFGSFNNFAKINERVLILWASILHAVPGSRLLLLAKCGIHRERASAALRGQGIAPERFEFLTYEPALAQSSPARYLQRYARVDIALDPFPYNGMTTTGDALWMGVPVVALRGASSIARASFSLLSNLGLPELAAHAEDEYLEIATRLARDLPRLAELRRTLRSRMEASVLMDTPRFTRAIETAYRAMWRRWCEG